MAIHNAPAPIDARKPATVRAVPGWIAACIMLSGITNKRTIIVMIAVLATIGALVATMSATHTTDLVGVGKKPRKAPTAIPNPFVPNTGTPATALAPDGVTHAAVLKIDTDMRYDGYAIVIDSWIKGGTLAEVRMWWLNPAKANERSPFGKGVTRYVDIGYDKMEGDAWRVRMRAGKRQFEFVVERCGDGHVAAFADIDTNAGLVKHCRVSKSNLKAKKILGLPTGLDKLTVTCTDAKGTTHHGTLRTKTIKR